MATSHNLAAVAVQLGLLPLPKGGAGDGDYIKWSPLKPGFTVKQGADGNVVFCATGNTCYKVEISVMSTAAANGVLTAIYQTQLQSPGGATFPIMVADGASQGTMFASPSAIIEAMPEHPFGQEASNLTWTIYADQCIVVEAGN